ncbi:MAG: hypothetical protein Q9191_006611 [Dirinaria sp. TL-2023a]
MDGDQDYDKMDVDDVSETGSDDIESTLSRPQTVSEVRRSLRPLQATADRVGKQVEHFAEHLDRYMSQKPKTIQKDCRHVLPLVNEYRRIASDTLKYLKGIHSAEQDKRASGTWKLRLRSSNRSLGSNRSFSSQSSQADAEENGGIRTSVKDLKDWEQEEQTWELLAHLLQVQYAVPQSEIENLGIPEKYHRPPRRTVDPRFSSEKDAWDQFLAEDDLAWERHTVVEWLKRCADASNQDIDEVVRDLELGADRGTSLWAHGWLYTKESVKGQKRLRSWPQALDPDDPGIESSLRSADKTKSLVTQLDPDAITRQGRDLESQDLYFERAMWLACWEMVRRGKEWSYIREWCQEKAEGWRATLMRGDPRALSADKTPPMSGWQSRALWRKVCCSAAKDGGVDQYENAVYGVLGGSLHSVLKVCGNWNDYLFAHYNTYLLRQFDDYESNGLSVSTSPSIMPITQSAFSRDEDGSQIVERMKSLESTKKQAATLTKMLQGSLIAKSFREFAIHQGVRLAQSANSEEESKVIPEPSERHLRQLEEKVTARITVEDYDMLRTVTHMLFVFQDLGMNFDYEDDLSAAENIVVAYIEYLSKAGKQQLLPLYASRLSPSRATNCLARQLPLIQDHSERRTVMSLMEKSGLDAPGILMTQLKLIILDAPPRPKSSVLCSPLSIVESPASNTGKMRAVKKSFIGDSISDDENDLINGFEWYLLIQDQWQQIMSMGAILYKHFLRRCSAATPDVRKLLTIDRSRHILGHIVDLSKMAEESEESNDDEEYESIEGGDRKIEKRLLTQARTFRDFENLFIALDAMERWKDAVEKMDGHTRSDGGDESLNSFRDTFKFVYGEVEAAIAPLLRSWLEHPYDDDEATQFRAIRRVCLPEVVLAFINVLRDSARFFTRDLLLNSMDLATLVAEEGSDVGECFMEAGKMAELVRAFAFTSQAIMRADEVGRGSKRSRRKLDGKSLEIWSIRARAE